MNREENIFFNSLKRKVDEYSKGRCSIISKEYLSSNEFLEHRNLSSYITSEFNQSKSPFLYILTEILTDDEKEELFKSKFEILNPHKAINVSEMSLLVYLSSAYGEKGTQDRVKEIKRNISKFTGVQFSQFIKKDKSVSYKIITLFYKIIMIDYPQVFSFLNQSNRKISFEFRDAFPIFGYEESKKNTAILSEIKSSLQANFSKDEIKKY